MKLLKPKEIERINKCKIKEIFTILYVVKITNIEYK